MIKILSKTLIFLIILTNFVLAENINSIIINGNKRITSETIFTLGELNLKNFYDDNKINETLKLLFETEFFEDIKINISDNKLIISVIENPIIEDIEIKGIKNKNFLDILYNNISLKNRKPFIKVNLEKDINFLQNILKSNGFYFSKISSTQIKNEELNSIRIKIDVDEGKKAKIKNISFLGNKKIKDKKLREIIASEEHRFWKFISKNVYLNKSKISLDRRLLERYYKNLGYYKVSINELFAEYSNEGYFNLIFNIDAGDQYFFNNFSLNLPEDYNKEDFNQIFKTFEKLKGDRYSLKNLDEILLEIEKIASLKLYDFIDANVEEIFSNDNKIDFSFNLFDSEKILC